METFGIETFVSSIKGEQHYVHQTQVHVHVHTYNILQYYINGGTTDSKKRERLTGYIIHYQCCYQRDSE